MNDNFKIAVDLLIEHTEAHLEQLRYLTNQFRDTQTDDEELEEHLKIMTESIERRIKVVKKFMGGQINE